MNALLVTILLSAAVTSAEEEIPCIVPEGHTDPEFVRHNFGEDEPVAGPICNKTGVLVQDLYNRCEKRHCCLAKCSCDHLSTLLPESMSTCPGRSSRSEPLVYNCYMPQIMNRYYLRVCCDGYEMNDDLICVRKINCSVDNGGCEHTCVTINGQATCQCNEGYQLTNTTECQDIDECEEGNHTCEDRCINEIGFYNCSCPAGFIVEATGKCTDHDECIASSVQLCDHECKNTAGSYKCECRTGYELNVDQHTCDDINECADPQLCDHECKNTAGSYKCECRTGYDLNVDQHTCDDIDECEINIDHCSQLCVNKDGGYDCDCTEGWELDPQDLHTCIDKAECSSATHDCEHYCREVLGSYECYCKSGYVPNGNACIDVNECDNPDKLCEHTCHNTDGNFYCSCDTGYTLSSDGLHCEDLNECVDSSDECDHICVNSPGSYTCDCRHGYELDEDLQTCKEIDECSSNPCEYTCSDKIGSYECSCPAGYRLASDQTSCVDINECTDDPAICGSTCINIKGSYECLCEKGYQLGDDKKTCYNHNECLTDNGGCQDNCTDTDGSYTCTCRPGYTLDIDGHSCNVQGCNLPCEHFCQYLDEKYSCMCKTGFTLNSDGHTCQGSPDLAKPPPASAAPVQQRDNVLTGGTIAGISLGVLILLALLFLLLFLWKRCTRPKIKNAGNQYLSTEAYDNMAYGELPARVPPIHKDKKNFLLDDTIVAVPDGKDPIYDTIGAGPIPTKQPYWTSGKKKPELGNVKLSRRSSVDKISNSPEKEFSRNPLFSDDNNDYKKPDLEGEIVEAPPLPSKRDLSHEDFTVSISDEKALFTRQVSNDSGLSLSSLTSDVSDNDSPPPYHLLGETKFHCQRLDTDDSGCMVPIDEKTEIESEYNQAKFLDVRPKRKLVQPNRGKME